MILFNTTLWLVSIAAAMTIIYEAIKIADLINKNRKR